MNSRNQNLTSVQGLNLCAGDRVEVRSIEEVLGTLDDRGCLDGLPFMPEMLAYCGKQFQVFKSAHKTCDTINDYKGRRMANAVHLEGLRCDGKAHGGCQAKCLLFWKDAWLKRVDAKESGLDSGDDPSIGSSQLADLEPVSVPEVLSSATVSVPADKAVAGDVRYSCQATELVRATDPLPWWQPAQYFKDLSSRNVTLFKLVRYMALATYNAIMRLHWRLRPYPHIKGLAGKKTPTRVLNLQPGELVQVRSLEEIMRTINVRQRNRGLFFDVEMVPFCGKTYRVLSRVDRILNEQTGEMMHLPNACIILENVTCSGCLSRDRLFCPRSIYPYWREIWLNRVEEPRTETVDSTSDSKDTHRAGNTD